MNTFWKLTVLGIIGIIMILTFFSPAIIAIATGNWWFLLLFLVSYIPVIGEAIVFASIISVMDK